MVASPSFAHLIQETAKRVSHPTVYGRTLWDARRDRGKFYGNLSDEAIVLMDAEMDAEIVGDELSSIRPLGSGSDFTVFLQRLGVHHYTTCAPIYGSDLYSGCQLSSWFWPNAVGRRIPLPLGIRFGTLDGIVRRPRFCQTRK